MHYPKFFPGDSRQVHLKRDVRLSSFCGVPQQEDRDLGSCLGFRGVNLGSKYPNLNF